MSWNFKSQFFPELWTFDQGVLYCGPLPPNQTHAHRAIQVLISPSGTVSVDQGSGSSLIQSQALIIHPHTKHRVKANLTMTFALFYEPSLTDPNQNLLNSGLEVVSPVKDDLTLFLKVPNSSFSTEEIALRRFQLGAKIAGFKLRSLDFDNQMLDSRIAKVVKRIDEYRGGKITLSLIASDLGISSSRLIHLFSEQMQMPLRSYFIWIKLRRALNFITSGKSITYASHESGFSDSAHFSRMFSKTFGFPPSYLRLMKLSNFNGPSKS